MHAPPIHWGAATAAERGPVIGTTTNRAHRNVIGTHSGSYGVYRALAVAAGALSREHRADLTNTAPTDTVGPYPQWTDPGRDRQPGPVGRHGGRRVRRRPGRRVRHPPDHRCHQSARDPARDRRGHRQGPTAPRRPRAAARRRGTGDQGRHRARLVPARSGSPLRLQRDRRCAGRCSRRPAGCIPSWSPAPTSRCSCRRSAVRPSTSSAAPRDLADPDIELTARVHDECNGSDVFGSDICTCRPYLTHAIEECIRGAQRGGVGLVSYSRKEGRALGEVTKFLVYNARKRQEGGDTADAVLRPHRMRGRGAGHAFPGTDARRAALAGHHQDPPAGVDEQHEVRRHHRLRNRSRRAGEHPRRPDPGRRPGGDRRQDGGGLLHARPGARRRRAARKPRAGDCRGESGGCTNGSGRRRPAGGRGRGTAHDSRRSRTRRATAEPRPRAATPHGSPCTTTPCRRLRREVADVTRAHYPDLAIPYHSRWRHFEAGGVDRRAELDTRLRGLRRCRARPRDDRSDRGQRAARRRRRTGLALSRGRTAASPARKGWGWPAFTPSPPGCSRRPVATRCGWTRPGCGR